MCIVLLSIANPNANPNANPRLFTSIFKVQDFQQISE